MLGVSLATSKRYLNQYREMGHIKAKRIPGRSPKKLAILQAGIVEPLRSYPDVSLEQHCELWEQGHGVRVSRWTMSEAIKRVEWTRKKSLWQKVERNEEERANWRRQMSQQEGDRLVFLDECGSNIALTPLSARARYPENALGGAFLETEART